MRRDFYLENGIYCKGLCDDFKLYYGKKSLTQSCLNIAYIKGVLIAVKTKQGVYVYKPKVLLVDDDYCLEKIAYFEVYNSTAYLKVKLQEHTYIIDANVQIKLCSCKNLS